VFYLIPSIQLNGNNRANPTHTKTVSLSHSILVKKGDNSFTVELVVKYCYLKRRKGKCTMFIRLAGHASQTERTTATRKELGESKFHWNIIQEIEKVKNAYKTRTWEKKRKACYFWSCVSIEQESEQTNRWVGIFCVKRKHIQVKVKRPCSTGFRNLE